MIKKLKSFLGIKEYLVEITWENGEKEIVPMKAWSPMNAIKKVEQTIDVVNEVYITILDDHTKFVRIRYCKATKKDTTR
ncbi:hypothetical protein CAI16_13475 [Virgibacillus dokdonensis]|uniref:Uncharacterized protein n=1 Tax=Virgibacillus dokdonensis TaxID=302167 RepID=A0A3E0WLM1_9BACI|nr:hypothetical protein [Virgibacillus dokdonensis]RFA33860.1 hypothetical protein CAI16_13475 [Virgibacillus dokdonensis]